MYHVNSICRILGVSKSQSSRKSADTPSGVSVRIHAISVSDTARIQQQNFFVVSVYHSISHRIFFFWCVCAHVGGWGWGVHSRKDFRFQSPQYGNIKPSFLASAPLNLKDEFFATRKNVKCTRAIEVLYI